MVLAFDIARKRKFAMVIRRPTRDPHSVAGTVTAQTPSLLQPSSQRSRVAVYSSWYEDSQKGGSPIVEAQSEYVASFWVGSSFLLASAVDRFGGGAAWLTSSQGEYQNKVKGGSSPTRVPVVASPRHWR